MRDRGKRRKSQDDKQGQENPAPLQPKFPDPTAAEVDADRQPDFVSAVRSSKRNLTITSNEPQPTGPAGGGEEPSQQCGATATVVADDAVVVAVHSRPRRPLPCLAPAVRPEKLARPRSATEAGEPAAVAAATPSSAGAARDQEVEGRGGALHRTARLRQEHMV